jgi:hypothetical protein
MPLRGTWTNFEISIGDVIDAFMAIMVLRTCEQIEGGLPGDVKSKMFFNIIVDFAVGLIPFVGSSTFLCPIWCFEYYLLQFETHLNCSLLIIEHM